MTTSPVRRRSRAVRVRQALLLAVALLGILAAVALGIALVGGGAGGPATGAAKIVPADALAYVNVSIDAGRSAVKKSLALARRFPDYAHIRDGILGRVAAILGGGTAVDYSRDVAPWLGNEAALGLLNTTSATAGTLMVFDIKNRARAQSFLSHNGASTIGTYRGVPLQSYSSGTELAFVKHFLLAGQDASVREAIDVSAGAAPALADSQAFQRTAAGEPADRVLDGYVSAAGVNRVLLPRGGLLGGLGTLLYEPALQGVAFSLSPTGSGARMRVHSTLDTSLTRLHPVTPTSVHPTLASIMPTGSTLLFDVANLSRVAPRVLAAAASAGFAGRVGPLLHRLGGALAAEGVNVPAVLSVFGSETALGVTPPGLSASPALVLVTRTSHPAKAIAQLGALEQPLAQLFAAPSTGPGQAPVFNDVTIDGVPAHQLSLTSGLQLDYAVFDGLVVLSTGRDGIAALATRKGSLADSSAYRSIRAQSPDRVTSLLFLDFSQLLSLGEQTGLTAASRVHALLPDLQRIQALGLSSTSGEADTTSELSFQIP